MKIAILSDLHFGVRNDSKIFLDYFLKFYEEIFFPYIEKEHITHLVILGDMFDRRKYINFYTLNQMRTRFVKRIFDLNLKTYILLGNHDEYYKNTHKINSMTELFGESEQIQIIDTPTKKKIGGQDFLFIPWINKDNEKECLSALKKKSKDTIVFGHLEINGFEMYAGIKHEEGGLKASTFRDFQEVYSGHFHHKSSRGNISYLGAPYEMTFNDYQDERGFHTYDTKIKQLHFIENPLHILFKIVYDDEDKSLRDLLDLESPEQYENSYIKIIVTKKTNEYFFEKFLSRINELKAVDVSVIDYIEMESYDAIDENAAIFSQDTLTILNNYIDERGDEVTKNALKNFFREIYSEAMSIEG